MVSAGYRDLISASCFGSISGGFRFDFSRGFGLISASFRFDLSRVFWFSFSRV